ncbi:MAG: alpha/beta fold hydrolase [Flavobacteriaceae bacterium]
MSTIFETIEFEALDGYRLGGRIFSQGEAPEAIVLVCGGIGAPQKIYAPLADRLAHRNLAVITFDYRGTGASRHEPLRRLKADLRDWGVQDMGGAIAEARRRFPGVSLLGIGQSFGAQALGLQPDPNVFSRFCAVATLSGYHGNTDESLRILLMMNLVGVPLTKVLGYFPGASGGFGANLPAGVFLQWAKWCRNKDYFFGDPELPETDNFARYRGPLLAIGLTDDRWGTPKALHALLRHYTNAQITECWLSPGTETTTEIGHFGFFRRENRSLWRHLEEFL